MDCLEHLDDYKAAIREANRVASKYVIIVLWRPFVSEGTRLNDRNMMHKEDGEQPWQDTFLHEYSAEALKEAFKENNMEILEEVSGPLINDANRYNYIYVLKVGR